MRIAILQLQKKIVRGAGVSIVDPRFQVSHGQLISEVGAKKHSFGDMDS